MYCPAAGSEGSVPIEEVAAAMSFVGAALDGDVDDGAGTATKFSGEGIGLDFELGDGIGIRLDHLGAEGLGVLRTLVVVDTVEKKVVLGMVIAVGDKPAGSAGDGIESAGGNTGGEKGQFRVAASGERKLDGRLAGDDLAEGALFGLNCCRACADLDGFTDGGDFEADTEQTALIDVNAQVGELDGFETRSGHFNVIGATLNGTEDGIAVG